MKIKIALGTAQFGLDYGINNKRGKITFSEVEKILKLAYENRINMLDTAFAYGNSENVIGSILERQNLKFNIISKLPADILPQEVLSYFNQSLKRLKQKKLYGYLLHDFNTFKKNRKIWNILKDLKKTQKIKKIGFSLYYPSEIDFLFENEIDFDIVQIPYSIFDQRFEPYFSKLKKRKIEIHVRSVFLQGLYFKNPKELSSHFNSIKEKINIIKTISISMNISIASICINFALINKNIDKLVIGVDNSQNLIANIKSLQDFDQVTSFYKDLIRLAINDENIILPFKWNN